MAGRRGRRPLRETKEREESLARLKAASELKKNILFTDKNGGERFTFSAIFRLFCYPYFERIFFFDLYVKFRKTKQKAITLVATTLKTLLTVTKASGRVSRRKFNAGNI